MYKKVLPISKTKPSCSKISCFLLFLGESEWIKKSKNDIIISIVLPFTALCIRDVLDSIRGRWKRSEIHKWKT